MARINFNPPRLPDTIYLRQRLHLRIKQALDSGSALWVQGPAGSGKTTLIASFLKADRRQVVWYQLDEADADASSFFRHMAITLKKLAATASLPVFDARLKQATTHFAREFFEAYFAQIPPGSVVVLDDYHEIKSSHVLDEILSAILKVLPPDRHLIILSRSMAPEKLSRDLAECRLSFLGWEALQLNDDEARQIAFLRVPQKLYNDTRIKEFNHRSQGWVAGLVLMIQQAVSGGLAADADRLLTPETVNAYFGHELFGQNKGSALETLVYLSFFPYFTLIMAKAITGNPTASELVDKLYHRGFFLTRYLSDKDELTYHLHPLFRDYLRHEAARRLSATSFNALQLRSARILADNGHVNEAIRLYQTAEAWPEAETLLLAEAQAQYQRGEFDLLLARLSKLPEDRIHNSAWLSLWRGASLAVTAANNGREDLEHAHTLFRRQGELTGALLAWCILVEGYVLEWGDMHPLDDWIVAFNELEPALPQVPAPLAHRATFAMFSAISYRRPYKPMIDIWTKRAEDVFINTDDPFLRMLMASQLSMYYGFSQGQLGRAAVFVNEIKAQYENAPNNPVANIVFLSYFASVHLWNTGDAKTSLEAVRKGIELVDTSGIHLMDFFLYAVGAWASITIGDYEQAEHYIAGLGKTFNQHALLNRCVYHDTAAILNIHRGNVQLARAQSDMSLELARCGGMPYAESVCLLTASRVCSLDRDWEGAIRYRQLASDIASSMNNHFIFNHLLWFEAADCLQRNGADSSIEPLRQALKSGREGNFYGNLWLKRDTLARLCHLALANDIETDYVQRLIASLDIHALVPAWGYDNWPYRLRIEVLTGLHVKRLTPDGYQSVKLQGRGRQLLETLVWLGGEAGQDRLADMVWPDADGDAARRNFDTTLHRLRRALGDERLLLLEDGRLSIEAGLVWTDFRTLDMARRDLTHALHAHTESTHIARIQEILIENMSSLPTSGPEEFGAIAASLQRKLEQALERAGEYWQKQAMWDNAVSAYEARLRLNPVAESPYLALMQIFISRGLSAEAMAVYRRCCENIKKHLGISPGSEIEAIRQHILTSNAKN